ncbi:unnamed protein product, partial [Prunus brigantina]
LEKNHRENRFDQIQSIHKLLVLRLGLIGAEANGSVVSKREEEEPEPCGLSGSAVKSTILDHHVVEVLVVGDGDEGVEIFAGKLSLETKTRNVMDLEKFLSKDQFPNCIPDAD